MRLTQAQPDIVDNLHADSVHQLVLFLICVDDPLELRFLRKRGLLDRWMHHFLFAVVTAHIEHFFV